MRVKDFPAESFVVGYSGMSREGNASVTQAWLVDIAPETPVGSGQIEAKFPLWGAT